MWPRCKTSVFQICSILQLHSEAGRLALTMVTRTLAAPVPSWNAKFQIPIPGLHSITGRIFLRQSPHSGAGWNPTPITSQCNSTSPSLVPAEGTPADAKANI